MQRTDILYDYYKESCALNKEAQIRRNKNFLLLCILEALAFLVLIKPEQAFELISNGIIQKLGFQIQIGNSIIQTLLWLLITYTTIKYIQDTLYIERQYKFLSKLEQEISSQLDSAIFSREGDTYLDTYPMVLNFIELFYKMFMPVFFIFINSFRIYKEWHTLSNFTLSLVCDTVLFCTIFIMIWFYFFEVHSKITEFLKTHIPFIDRIAKKLRAILKAV